MFIKINSCNEKDKAEAFRIASVYGVTVEDYNRNTVLLQCTQTEDKNNDLITLLRETFGYRLEVVRGGSQDVPLIQRNLRTFFLIHLIRIVSFCPPIYTSNQY